jgi:hypothetical protein
MALPTHLPWDIMGLCHRQAIPTLVPSPFRCPYPLCLRPCTISLPLRPVPCPNLLPLCITLSSHSPVMTANISLPLPWVTLTLTANLRVLTVNLMDLFLNLLSVMATDLAAAVLPDATLSSRPTSPRACSSPPADARTGMDQIHFDVFTILTPLTVMTAASLTSCRKIQDRTTRTITSSPGAERHDHLEAPATLMACQSYHRKWAT